MSSHCQDFFCLVDYCDFVFVVFNCVKILPIGGDSHSAVYQPDGERRRNYAVNDFVTVRFLWWADLLSGKGNHGHAVASVSLR